MTMDTIASSIFFKLSLLVCSVIAGNNELTASKSYAVGSVLEMNFNLPRPVLGYRSYMDIFPTRYDVPSGLSSIIWTFQAIPSSKSCGNGTVNFLIQQGGLPLVNQSRLTFPDNYVIQSTSLLGFELVLGRAVSFSLLRPPPGPFYVIAYTNSVDTKIRQKGLSSSNDCALSYVTSLQLGNPIQRLQLSLYAFHTIPLVEAKTLISFTLPTSSYGFQVSIVKCDSPNCSISLTYQAFNVDPNLSQDCSDVNLNLCVFVVPSPPLGDEQHVVITTTAAAKVEVKLIITPYVCKNYLSHSCIALPQLGRINTIQPNFATLSYSLMGGRLHGIRFSKARTLLIPFNMMEPNDIGATLHWKMRVSLFMTPEMMFRDRNLSDIQVHVCGGLLYNYLPDLRDAGFDACTNLSRPVHVSMLGLDRNESVVYVPYPKVGTWHILLQATCFRGKNRSEIPCPIQTSVDMAVNVRPCINNGCGGRGQCLSRTVGSDLVMYTACRCYADYRGYGCDDDSQAFSKSVQLAGAFLLTLSNLLFVPSICIAIRRRFFVEAFVYFYTMFFSTFYHACDGDRSDQYRLCMIKFDVLQSADFFGSSSALWITLVAMAMIRCRYVTPVLQLMGPFGLFIGVVYDKTSLYVIAAPIVAGLVTIVISWSFKMYKRRKLYPTKRRYLLFLLPGILLATVAAVLYTFIETQKNYKYLHSIWHICIALSICLLLPPRPVSLTDDSKSSTDMTTPLTQINTVDAAIHE